MQESSSSFKFSNMVCLDGLKNIEFNGQLAIINSDEIDERYEVALCTNHKKKIRVKKENLLFVCACCYKGGLHFQVCGKCKMVRYCNLDCQKEDWKRHKTQCPTLKNTRTILRSSDLHKAILLRKLDTVKELIERGENINVVDRDGRTALIVASCCADLKSVHHLVSRGANIEIVDKRGHTPLIHASQIGSLSIVKYLLEKGAVVNNVTDLGVSSLTFACLGCCLEIVQLLIHYGANINQADNKGFTPLHVVCQENSFDIIKCLIQNGVDINKASHQDITALWIACKNENFRFVKYLLNHGADVNL
jgi:ankyrin repeat protein